MTGYQLLPALRQSIIDHGQQVPILCDAEGAIIDGHHRQRIMDELATAAGVQPATLFPTFTPTTEAVPA